MQTINPDKNKKLYTFPLTTLGWNIVTPRKRDLVEVIDDHLFYISDKRHELTQRIDDVGYTTVEAEEILNRWDKESEILVAFIIEGPSSELLKELCVVADLDRPYFHRLHLLASPYLRGTEYEIKEVTGATIVYADTEYDQEIPEEREIRQAVEEGQDWDQYLHGY